MRPAKLDWVPDEIIRMRGQIARRSVSSGLQRASVSTASAEALLVRMRSKVDALQEEKAALRRHGRAPLVGENGR